MLKAFSRAFVDGLIENDEKVAFLKKINSRMQKPYPS